MAANPLSIARDPMTAMPDPIPVMPDPIPVMPVKTGIQSLCAESWIPAFAGMTTAYATKGGLTHAGKLRADVAEKLALERYETFDSARREAERLAADREDVAALERMEHKLEGKGRGKKK